MQNNPYPGQQNISPMRGGGDFRSENELMEKVSILQREFADIDINHDSWISRQELFGYLDRKNGTPFDRAIAEEIYDRMDKDRDGRITINEFIKVYIEADEMLRKKIESAKINKESYKRQEEECRIKAEQERANEKVTAYGIAHNSVAHVTINAATNLGQRGPTRPSNPYVEVSFNDQDIVKTKIASGGANVEWNEKISFDVVNPQSYLKFTVYDSKIPAGDIFEGYVVVELEDLRDQNSHDVVLELLGENGQPGRGQLHVKLQWIHSKAKYFAMIAQKWQENYAREDEELREYERYLQTLYQPFPGLRIVQRVSARPANEPNRINLPDTTNLDSHFLSLMNRAARTIAKQENPNEGFWVYITTAACVIELLIAIFISFARPTFFDLIYPCIVLLYLRGGLLREIASLKVIALVVLLSVVVFDLVWMFIYSGKWTDDATNDSAVEGRTRGFVIFMSFINIIVKVVLAMLCYMVDLQFIKQRGSVPRNALREPSPARSQFGR